MKEFKTIPEQREILRNRGMVIPHDQEHILEFDNYYIVINGYKDLFLQNVKPERFIHGTSLAEVFRVSEFDRELRMFLFRWIMVVEQRLKTVISHSASGYYKADSEFYLKTSSYDCDKKSARTVDNTIKHLRTQYNRQHPSLYHYRSVHGCIPFWVLVNWITFGEISHFYSSIQPRGIRESIVKKLKAGLPRPQRKLTVERLSTYMRLLGDFRNVCAHHERCYSFRHRSIILDGDHKACIVDILQIISVFLTEKERYAFVQDFRTVLIGIAGRQDVRKESVEQIMIRMGLPAQLPEHLFEHELTAIIQPTTL